MVVCLEAHMGTSIHTTKTNAAYPQGMGGGKYHTNPFSIHVDVATKATQLIFLGTYVVPSPKHHHTKNTHVVTECVFVAAVLPSVRAQQAA